MRTNSKSPRLAKYLHHKLQKQLLKLFLVQWSIFFFGTCCLGFVLQYLENPSHGVVGSLVAVAKAYGPILLFAGCLIPLFGNEVVRFSNRIVGPMIRTRYVLQSLSKGELESEIKFRDDDFYIEVADDLNALLKKLREDRELEKKRELKSKGLQQNAAEKCLV